MILSIRSFSAVQSRRPERRDRQRSLAAGFALCAALAAAPSHAEVQYFAQVPSRDTLRSALALPEPRVARGQAHVRGIDWSAHRPAAAGTAKGGEKPGAVQATARPPAGGATEAAVAMPIAFDPASARVAASGLPFLASIADLLAKDGTLHLLVEGHTDASGDPARNLLLSWDRALSVVRVLAERYGIDPERLQPIGKGDREPLEDAMPLDGRNRRVQFRVARGKEI